MSGVYPKYNLFGFLFKRLLLFVLIFSSLSQQHVISPASTAASVLASSASVSPATYNNAMFLSPHSYMASVTASASQSHAHPAHTQLTQSQTKNSGLTEFAIPKAPMENRKRKHSEVYRTMKLLF